MAHPGGERGFAAGTMVEDIGKNPSDDVADAIAAEVSGSMTQNPANYLQSIPTFAPFRSGPAPVIPNNLLATAGRGCEADPLRPN